MTVTYNCDHCGKPNAYPNVSMPILNAAGTLNFSRSVELCRECVLEFLALADAFVPPSDRKR